jgi:hypothetical protein
MLDQGDADPAAVTKAKEIDGALIAVFRIIVRNKSDKSFVYFKVRKFITIIIVAIA